LHAGESGLGKSTFVNTLFGDNLVATEDLPLDERSTKAIRKTTFGTPFGIVSVCLIPY